MYEVRLEFSKLGRARFLSHLDTMRVFQRALTRAQIPVIYSQGFNPHMKMSIAFPLPLGVESLCEIIDLKLEEPISGLVEKLNAALPEGFRTTKTLPLYNINEITHINYSFIFNLSVDSIFNGRPLIVEKKTKRGFENLDISPYVKDTNVDGNTLTISLSAQPPMISPSHVLSAYENFYHDIEIVKARRICFLGVTL